MDSTSYKERERKYAMKETLHRVIAAAAEYAARGYSEGSPPDMAAAAAKTLKTLPDAINLYLSLTDYETDEKAIIRAENYLAMLKRENEGWIERIKRWWHSA